MTAARKTRQVPVAAHIGRRVHSAERIVRKWTTTYPRLPMEVRERLADMLLAEDPADPTEVDQ